MTNTGTWKNLTNSECARWGLHSFLSNGYNSRFEEEEAPEPRIRLQLTLPEVSHGAPDQRVIRHVDVEFWEAGDGGRNPRLGVKCLDVDEERGR